MLLDLRIILSILLLFCASWSLFVFAFSNRPLKKIISLAISYNSIIILMCYVSFMQNKEDLLSEFITMVFISFVLNISIGMGIINNFLRKKDRVK